MLSALTAETQRLVPIEVGAGGQIPARAVWIDLLEPTLQEEQLVERWLRIDVPTREEMREIETSNRLYEENGALYMTMTVAARLDTDRPESTAVTFILSNGTLITTRYIDTRPFQQFAQYIERNPAATQSSVAIVAGLVEAFIERIADVLERLGGDLDGVSSNIFARTPSTHSVTRNLQALIERIGFNGELNSKARESLVSLGRLLVFLQQSNVQGITDELRTRLRSSSRDVTALSDHSTFLGSKVTFLLEATLGMINIEQNNIIKIFSVAAVMFLPPTFIASVYGMNFDFMPELQWKLGYPFALLLIVISAVVPYLWFRRKGWL